MGGMGASSTGRGALLPVVSLCLLALSLLALLSFASASPWPFRGQGVLPGRVVVEVRRVLKGLVILEPWQQSRSSETKRRGGACAAGRQGRHRQGGPMWGASRERERGGCSHAPRSCAHDFSLRAHTHGMRHPDLAQHTPHSQVDVHLDR
jgi:hypothetical protein